MTMPIRFHRIAALVVLVAAGIWVGTGKFSSVGSEEAHASQPAASPETAAGQPVAASPRTVSAIVPEINDHAREIRISGVTAPDKHAVLAARSNGIIESLSLVKGSAVKATTVVMTLEGPDMTAGVTIAEVTLDQRKRELEVAEKLFARGSLAETQLINARSALAAAGAEMNRARAAVDRLELRAPFSGVVDSIDVELGEWVQEGAPIATILSLDPIVVVAEVSEQDIGFVAPGATASLRLANGTEMGGKVRFVAKAASSDTRTYRIEVALPNADYRIPSGMTADVRLYTASVATVTVPRSIITLSETGEIGLRVVGTDNIARFAAVELIDDTAEGLVLTGKFNGVRIIVAGQDLVRDGETVTVIAATRNPAEAPAKTGAEVVE